MRRLGTRFWLGLLIALLAATDATAQTPDMPKGPADIISGSRKKRAEAEMQRAVEAVPSQVEAVPSPSQVEAVPSPSQATPGADPHAGVPGAPQLGGADPHAGVPGAPKLGGADPHAGVPGAPKIAGAAPAEAAPPGPAPSQPAPAPAVGGNPHAGVAGAPPVERKPLSESRAASDLATGTLRVQVVDQRERPVPGAEIQLGILRSMGDRETMEAKADQTGQHLFTKLPVGDRQAYRVNVLAGGARFSSTPFRMPHSGGYHVVVRQLPTTTRADQVVLYVGAVSVELKDERLKIAQQQRFVNIGNEAYVFPKGGLRLPLPKGFTAFQTQETMGDQHISADETHLIIEGSLPPGQTRVLWGYDVPIEGSEQTLELDNPWVTFAFRVLADAPDGLTLAVDGFPPAQRHEDQGKSYWVTEVRRTPDQESMRSISIRIAGIPGPGPMRWVAAVFALLAVLIGLALARSKPHEGGAPVDSEALEARRDALLEEARMLAREREEEAIGPEYYAEERARLVDELSVVLWQLEGEPEGKRQPKAKPATAKAGSS